MKHLFLLAGVFLLAPLQAWAETEEEEMMRMQMELNQSLFDDGKQEEEPAPAAPPPVEANSAPPAPVSTPEPAAEPEALPKTHFTHYQLAGLRVGLSKDAAFEILKKKGFGCNIQAAKQFQAMMGRTVCMYASMSSPKLVLMTFTGGVLKDFELEEEYKTAFPEKIFAREKNKFVKKYGNEAQCKTQRRGESCEVFGHGYRIMLKSEYRREKAKITHSFSTL